VVQAGSDGVNEDFIIGVGAVAIDCRYVGDLSTPASHGDVKDMLRSAYHSDGETTITDRARQLRTFGSRI